MRYIFFIVFLSKLILIAGQENQNEFYSLDKAISVALDNNPYSSTLNDKKQLTFQVKSNWQELIYYLSKLKLLDEYQKVLDGYSRLINLKYSSGDIDILDSYKLNEKVASIQTSVLLTLNEYEITNNILQQLLFINCKIIPVDSNLVIYEIDKRFNDNLSNIPDTLNKCDTLHSEYEKFKDSKIIENKQLELDNLFIKLLLFKNYKIELADLLIQSANAKYKSEDIDFIEFVDYISAAYKIRSEYVEILKMYNQKAIELEYFAY